MRKFIIIAEMRQLEKQVSLGEISYSRMIEILNEKADEYASQSLPLKQSIITDEEIKTAAYLSHNIPDEGEADYAEKQFIQGANYVINKLPNTGSK